MISKQDVIKAASLAKLKLTSAEEDTFARDLARIVEYVDELKEVSTQGVEPVSHITGLENSFRDDQKPVQGEGFPEGQGLIGQAPRTKNGYVAVPRILSDL